MKRCSLHIFVSLGQTPRLRDNGSSRSDRLSSDTLLIPFHHPMMVSSEFRNYLAGFQVCIIVSLFFPGVCKLSSLPLGTTRPPVMYDPAAQQIMARQTTCVFARWAEFDFHKRRQLSVNKFISWTWRWF